MERLFAMFEDRLDLTAVVTCVRDCSRELEARARRPSLSSVEQRAHRRLIELAEFTELTDGRPTGRPL